MDNVTGRRGIIARAAPWRKNIRQPKATRLHEFPVGYIEPIVAQGGEDDIRNLLDVEGARPLSTKAKVLLDEVLE